MGGPALARGGRPGGRRTGGGRLLERRCRAGPPGGAGTVPGPPAGRPHERVAAPVGGYYLAATVTGCRITCWEPLSRMRHVFTSESVTEGHPDKVADAISDAVLDAILARDNGARVACETLVTTGMAVVAGEITTSAYVHIP